MVIKMKEPRECASGIQGTIFNCHNKRVEGSKFCKRHKEGK